MDNREFQDTKNEIFTLIENGDFNIYEYARCFGVLFVIQQLLEIKTEELEALFTANFPKAEEKTAAALNGFIEHHFDHIYSDLNNFSPILGDLFYNSHNEFKKKQNEEKITEIFNNWENHIQDISLFYSIIGDIDATEICNYIIASIPNRKFTRDFYFALERNFGMVNVKENYGHLTTKLVEINSALKLKIEEFSLVDKYWMNEIINRLDILIPTFLTPYQISGYFLE